MNFVIKKFKRVYVKKGENMQINNYQPNQNPNFGARFINNVKDLNINTKKVGALFEKLTKDSPNEILSLDKKYSWCKGEVDDIFTLSDNQNNKLAKIACSFTTHSEIDGSPEKQASLLNNIFRFIKERARENAAFKEIDIEMKKLKEQEKILNAKEAELKKLQDKNVIQDASKYNIEIADLKSDDPHFETIYKTAQSMISVLKKD